MSNSYENRLRRLRSYRVRAEPDLSLGFLEGQFKREVARPLEQLGEFTQLWSELVPAGLVEHTRLVRFHRGVLHVAVDSSAHLYELNRLLQQGMERELMRRARRQPLRRVKLQLGSGG